VILHTWSPYPFPFLSSLSMPLSLCFCSFACSFELHMLHLSLPLSPSLWFCSSGYWDAPKKGPKLNHMLVSSGVHYRNISSISEGSTWAFTMLSTMCILWLSIRDIVQCAACF
jgi:hypothetical protein